MTRSWAGSYSMQEVRALVEGYQELREVKGTFRWPLSLLCQLVDLERALSTLPTWEYSVVLLHGLMRLEHAEQHLACDRSAMYERYRVAIENMTNYLNGG